MTDPRLNIEQAGTLSGAAGGSYDEKQADYSTRRSTMYYNNPSGVSVHDGFPNPATDSSLQGIDLNQLLIRHNASTYMMRITGNEWARQGIFAGDMLLVDRALAPRGNDPVVWIKDGQFALSPKHKIPEHAEVWGSVTATIHQYRENVSV